jgi:CheY-like chemotaxis protein
LRATCQLASALAKLVAKLLDRPVLTPPSAVHAIAEAVRLLEELSPRDVGPDLSDPPIRVMVVDDDPVSRRAISNALQLIFGKPDNAENGEAAVALAESKIFDVIFLDILMPDMDGFDTCSKIRKTRSNGATPVVFVSGQNDAESKEKSLQCGGNGFISKPVLPAEIYLTALTFSLRRRVDKGKAAPSVTEPAAEVVC